jgi:hypothetical protein
MLFISIIFSVNIFAQTEDLKTYSKFDFVPGNKVLFFDDFSETAIGEFPIPGILIHQARLSKQIFSPANG